MSGERTLVLGGGGIAGLGWLAGLLYGLFERGVDLRDADRMIGTSAGAATAAQLCSSQSIEQLFARQSDPALIADEPSPSREAMIGFTAAFPAALKLTDRSERLRALAALARSGETVPPELRRTMIERRLTDHTWPEQALTITAVDVGSGGLVAFDRHSNADLVDAVTASCAVPGIWPVVTIAGRAYMDGGAFSMDNAHLAEGAAKVIIASPLGGSATHPPGYRLVDQVAFLERTGSEVLAISPTASARKAMGANPFDPSIRIPSAQAGLAQGRDMAEAVATFWG